MVERAAAAPAAKTAGRAEELARPVADLVDRSVEEAADRWAAGPVDRLAAGPVDRLAEVAARWAAELVEQVAEWCAAAPILSAPEAAGRHPATSTPARAAPSAAACSAAPQEIYAACRKDPSPWVSRSASRRASRIRRVHRAALRCA